MTFGTFLDRYLLNFVSAPSNLAASTKAKYERHIRNHLRPAFGETPLGDITTEHVQHWLNEKNEAGLAWATRNDLRNLLGAIFTTAQRWGTWDGRNPARWARVGRRKAAREKRKLSSDDLRSLLNALPPDVRMLSVFTLCTGMRISEALGLEWRHIDFTSCVVRVRQRFYRGDLDTTKSERSVRDIPLGHLTEQLRALYPGPAADQEFVFSIQTSRGISRDESSIRRYFLTKAAKRLGIYWKGFGWHAFRREAITSMAAFADPIQAMRLAGHTRMEVTLLYGLNDLSRQSAAICRFQEQLGITPTLTR